MRTKHIAYIVIEANTPLKVGCGSSDYLQDSPVQKDWNGLPMILGTSIAGVLRKNFAGDKNDIFGDEDAKKEDSKGSKIIISNALLCIDDANKVCEELLLENKKTKIMKLFDNLPIREHTAIDHKGVTLNGAKFDEEVVYKGSRFKFSIESIEDDIESLEGILDLLLTTSFRLGGGSSKGFGKFKIHSIEKFDTSQEKDYTSSLDYVPKNPDSISKHNTQQTISKNFFTYKLKIKPDDFFMFGSGFGDEDADMTPVYEKVVDYPNKKLSENKILIPASGIKGALSHRTAFYYNKNKNNFIDENKKNFVNEYDSEENALSVGENNEAVKTLFGYKKELDKDNKTKELGQKGKILISDCFKSKKESTKVFDHVSIDRFTGGTIDGALFQEKTVVDDSECYEIEILLEKYKLLERDDLTQEKENLYIESRKAFECALRDITTGMLALGGSTTKGHGVFSGSLELDGKAIIKGDCDGK